MSTAERIERLAEELSRMPPLERGDFFKELRKMLYMSQKDLAAHMKASDSTVSRIEKPPSGKKSTEAGTRLKNHAADTVRNEASLYIRGLLEANWRLPEDAPEIARLHQRRGKENLLALIETLVETKVTSFPQGLRLRRQAYESRKRSLAAQREALDREEEALWLAEMEAREDRRDGGDESF